MLTRRVLALHAIIRKLEKAESIRSVDLRSSVAKSNEAGSMLGMYQLLTNDYSLALTTRCMEIEIDRLLALMKEEKYGNEGGDDRNRHCIHVPRCRDRRQHAGS